MPEVFLPCAEIGHSACRTRLLVAIPSGSCKKIQMVTRGQQSNEFGKVLQEPHICLARNDRKLKGIGPTWWWSGRYPTKEVKRHFENYKHCYVLPMSMAVGRDFEQTN